MLVYENDEKRQAIIPSDLTPTKFSLKSTNASFSSPIKDFKTP